MTKNISLSNRVKFAFEDLMFNHGDKVKTLAYGIPQAYMVGVGVYRGFTGDGFFLNDGRLDGFGISEIALSALTSIAGAVESIRKKDLDGPVVDFAMTNGANVLAHSYGFIAGYGIRKLVEAFT
jgi:hypothetical protein